MKTTHTEPERWAARGAGSALEDSLGVALRAAAEATSPVAADVAPLRPARAASAASGRWSLPVIAGALVLVAGGAVGATQVVRAVRAAREPLGTVDVPRGSSVSINGRHGRRIQLAGPIALEGDVDRIVLSGTGEARVEAGERPLEIRAPSGSAIDLPAGATWSAALAAAPVAPVVAAPVAPVVAAPVIAPPVAPEPEPAPAPTVAILAEHPRRAARPSSASPSAPASASASEPPSPPPSPLAPAAFAAAPAAPPSPEAALVAAAFRALRADHDPARALELLDQHAARFPLGVLAVEAGMARVEALLAEGDRRRALTALEALPDGPGAPPPARALLRGELRASLGRCREALGDFDAALAGGGGGGTDELGDRARAGRAACRARLGGPDETSAPLPTREGVEGTPR